MMLTTHPHLAHLAGAEIKGRVDNSNKSTNKMQQFNKFIT